MKNKNRFFFWALVPLWAILVLWNFIAPAKDFSESENRYLAAFPTYNTSALLDGRFMDSVNDYLNDHFVGRPYWVGAQSLLEYGMGKREINSVFLHKHTLLSSLTSADTHSLQRNILGINAFCKEYNLPAYVALVPSAAVVQPERLPALAHPWNEAEAIEQIYRQLSPAITAVDVFSVLKEHSGEYIYYRTDHHWTSYGAYLAYTQLAPALGLPQRAQEEFAVTTLSNNFVGTYQSRTGLPWVTPDTLELYEAGQAVSYEIFFDPLKPPEEHDSLYFEEYLAKKDKYAYFLGPITNSPYVRIHTGSDSGQKLIVFKDSYAHCLIPMLLADYSEICLVDLRAMQAANYDDYLHVADYDAALFLYSTDVFARQRGASLFVPLATAAEGDAAPALP